MSLSTHSKFYYGFEVTADAYLLDFSEGAGELTAELDVGAYSLEDFADEISRAMNEAGALTYTVSVDRATRKITISAGSNFSLLVATGSHLGTSIFEAAGFTGADRSGAASYEGAAAGSEYATQFVLQSYVGPDDFQDSTYGTVNKSASGKIEVVSFGEESFIEANIAFVTDRAQPSGGPIRNNASGVNNLRALMQYLITKGPLEFMPDESDPDTFHEVVLESTPDDARGLRYKLRELYGRGLPGFFETGVLKFRVTN